VLHLSHIGFSLVRKPDFGSTKDIMCLLPFGQFYELDLSDFVYMLSILSFPCAVQDDSLFLAIELHVLIGDIDGRANNNIRFGN